jgi:spoIIIJ-associated protein
MREVEASAKSREEAIQKALDALGVEMYEVDDIQILDEGSRGIFGLGARQVKVKIRVDHLPDAPPPPKEPVDRPVRQDRQDRPQRNDTQNRGGRQQGRGERRGGRGEQRQSRTQDNTRTSNETRPERGDKRPGQRSEDSAEKDRGGDRPKRSEQQRTRGSRNTRDDRKGRSSQPKGAEPEKAPAAPPPEPIEDDLPENLPPTEAEEQLQALSDAAEEEAYASIPDDLGNEAAALLQETIEKMSLAASVKFTRADDGTARLNVESEDGAILIGRKGRNLSAMQYLINRMISRSDANESTERLVVDVEGYVDRRRASLEDMARSMARRAKETGRNVRLKPMSPQERRIIHLILQDDPEVRTFSMGESLYRSVVIGSKNARPERARPERGRGGRSSRGGRGRGGRNPGRRPGRDAEIDAGTFGD